MMCGIAVPRMKGGRGIRVRVVTDSASCVFPQIKWALLVIRDINQLKVGKKTRYSMASSLVTTNTDVKTVIFGKKPP